MDVLTTSGRADGVTDPLAGCAAFARTDQRLIFFVMKGGYAVNEIGENVAGMPTGFLS